VQVAVERRVAALNGVEAARLTGDELALIAADQAALGALVALQRARQEYRLHSYGSATDRVAPKVLCVRDDDVFRGGGSSRQIEQPRTVDGKLRCAHEGCRGFKKLDTAGRCPHHPAGQT
jgi:hypothetical protein